MSKRVEKAAKAFHNQALSDAQEYARMHGGSLIEEVSYGRGLKAGFIKGYEQAEKDTIERAIQWLITHADDYIVDMEVSRYKPSKLHVGGMCWEHLKQAMEKE